MHARLTCAPVSHAGVSYAYTFFDSDLSNCTGTVQITPCQPVCRHIAKNVTAGIAPSASPSCSFAVAPLQAALLDGFLDPCEWKAPAGTERAAGCPGDVPLTDEAMHAHQRARGFAVQALARPPNPLAPPPSSPCARRAATIGSNAESETALLVSSNNRQVPNTFIQSVLVGYNQVQAYVSYRGISPKPSDGCQLTLTDVTCAWTKSTREGRACIAETVGVP